MYVSNELAELKYQEHIEQTAAVTDGPPSLAAIVNPQTLCLGTAIVMGLFMGGCALIFMPNSDRSR